MRHYFSFKVEYTFFSRSAARLADENKVRISTYKSIFALFRTTSTRGEVDQPRDQQILLLISVRFSTHLIFLYNRFGYCKINLQKKTLFATPSTNL